MRDRARERRALSPPLSPRETARNRHRVSRDCRAAAHVCRDSAALRHRVARVRGVPRPIHRIHRERVRSARRGTDEVFLDSGRDGKRAETTVDVDLLLDRELAGRCRRSTASSRQRTRDNRNCPRRARWSAPRAASRRCSPRSPRRFDRLRSERPREAGQGLARGHAARPEAAPHEERRHLSACRDREARRGRCPRCASGRTGRGRATRASRAASRTPASPAGTSTGSVTIPTTC